MVLPRGTLTLEEFLRLPEEEPALEYVDGVIVQKVSPRGQHAVLQGWLVRHIDDVGVPPRVAKAFPELRTTFAGKSFVPDVAVYRWDRIPLTTDGKVADEFYLPPDVVFEITSPEQSVTTLDSKCHWYVSNGVLIAVLVHVRREAVRVFRPGTPTSVLRGADVVDLGDTVPGLRLTPRELFGALRLR